MDDGGWVYVLEEEVGAINVLFEMEGICTCAMSTLLALCGLQAQG
jgi:hypothetical protein